MRTFVTTILAGLLFTSPLYAQSVQGTLQDIDTSGKINIGYRQSLPPMSFLNQDGVPAGYSIDLCHEVVKEVEKELNKKIAVEYVPVTAKQRFTALTDKKIDILCGSTTNTLARRKQVDFTELTFVTGSSFLTFKGSKLQNHFDGKKIGVVRGTTTAPAVKKLLEEAEAKAEIVLLDSIADGVTALNAKKIDGLAADQVVLIGLIVSSDTPKAFEILPSMFTFDPVSLAVRRNDADFRLVADRAITEIFRSNQISTIYDKWFSKFSRKMPTGLQALIKLNSIPVE